MSETVADRVYDHWGTVVGVVGLVYAAILAPFIVAGPVLLAVTFDLTLGAAMRHMVVAGTVAYLLLAVGLLR